MKSIALLRHAKSSWDNPSLADFDRPLSPRGEKAARRMGEELRQRDLRFDLVISSPARRAVDTIRLVEEAYGGSFNIRFEPQLYDSPVSRLMKIVREVDHSVDRLLLVGHSPELQESTILLAERDDPLLPSVEFKFPTGAIALLELPAKRWEDAALGSARMVAFIRPRDLKRE
jgi:phosphohistidine phosphatase